MGSPPLLTPPLGDSSVLLRSADAARLRSRAEGWCRDDRPSLEHKNSGSFSSLRIVCIYNGFSLVEPLKLQMRTF